MRRLERLVVGCLAAGLLAGLAPGPAGAAEGEAEEAWLAETPRPVDPLEPVNRTLFKLNLELYDHVLEPAYGGYLRTVPASIRTVMRNFFDNARLPFSTANAVIAGRFDLAGDYAKRFAVNTTFGALGTLDVATEVGLASSGPFTVGDVLCTYDVPPGPYVMVPFFGPNNARSLAGRVGDALTGYNILDQVYPVYFAGINLNRYERARGTRGLLEASIDPYLAARTAFAQVDSRCGDLQ